MFFVCGSGIVRWNAAVSAVPGRHSGLGVVDGTEVESTVTAVRVRWRLRLLCRTNGATWCRGEVSSRGTVRWPVGALPVGQHRRGR
jgi:hypothetical protein